MATEEILFNTIVEKLSSENDHIAPGKMMSSPGICYKNKVFAFYYDKQMVFRLGKGFNLQPFGIGNFSFLSPFKNKPPMTGWYQITAADSGKWELLAREACKVMAAEVKKK